MISRTDHVGNTGSQGLNLREVLVPLYIGKRRTDGEGKRKGEGWEEKERKKVKNREREERESEKEEGEREGGSEEEKWYYAPNALANLQHQHTSTKYLHTYN